MIYATIPILYSAERCGILFDENSRKREIEANCPFCSDKKKHMSMNTEKNLFRCNLCEESGNSITLYAKIHGVDNSTAYWELEAGNVFRARSYVKKPAPEVRRHEIKPLAARHDVYYDMLQMLELSPVHRRQLLDRGLDGAAIERNVYRSVPEPYSKLYATVIYRLSKEYELDGIPGFYMRNGKWHLAAKNGLFVPVCNSRGYIQGMQIRLDDVAQRKYRWLSSNHYDSGAGVEPWAHIANWNGNKSVYVTEGPLKAEVASFLMDGACVIGIPGVNCADGLAEILLGLGVNEIIEAFDMDKASNPYVEKAVRALKRQVAGAGIKVRSATWSAAYKGIDDLCLAMREARSAAA